MEQNVNEKVDSKKLSKKKITIVGIGATVVAGTLVAVLLLTQQSPMEKYFNQMDAENYTEAKSLYIEASKDEETKILIDEEMKTRIESVFEAYKNETMSYIDANSELTKISHSGYSAVGLTETKEAIGTIEKSRAYYQTAEEYRQRGDYQSAIEQYAKMSEIDPMYEVAQQTALELAVAQQADVVATAKDLEEQGDLPTAIDTLMAGKKLFPENVEMEVLYDQYVAQYEEYIKTNAEVSVVKAEVYKYGNYTDFYSAQASVKNNTDKVVKDYSITFLGYDADGYPVQIGYRNYFINGSSSACNIKAGETDTSRWNMSYNESSVKKLIACVKEVEYFEGDTWTNPYYEIWMDKYEGKIYQD